LGVANATNEFGSNQAFFGWGGAIVTGIDYYWGEKFYFGFEIGLDVVNINFKDVMMAEEIVIESTQTFTGFVNMNNTLKMGFNF
jgi:hypothetical protein